MVKNKRDLINLSGSKKDQVMRANLLEILEYALKAADPFVLTKQKLRQIDFKKYKKVYVVGAGKGSFRMALAAEEILKTKLTAGVVSIPEKLQGKQLKKIKVNLAGHPFPTEGSFLGAKKVLELVGKAKKGDLVLGLFSGGASALLSYPADDISLEEKIETTRVLLRCGANIQDLNSVRKHLSQIKGGRLAEKLKEGEMISFYLSDVVGNDLSTIASGPTVPDKTTFAKAVEVLNKYGVCEKIPRKIKQYLEEGSRGMYSETPKNDFVNVTNLIIGSHETLAKAAAAKATKIGFKAEIITEVMQGFTDKIGPAFVNKMHRDNKKRLLYAAAGETTFKVKTKQPGGRNQQMALAVLPYLKSGDYFLAFDSDGVDGVGPEKVGGAMVDYNTLKRAHYLKMDPLKALDENDAYNFFNEVGGLIKTGYVGTNLGDMVIFIMA
ncbi:MAG: DUF4147 domain-containing protein [Candidatus Magasanikbacteria bacterium]|nr:DUF4147 domain-containing protein [Candidatus Magasanikbacteria bacterium]